MPTATCSSATATDVSPATTQLRDAAPGDAAEVTAIYASEVLHGTSSYETTPPAVDEMAARMAAVGDAGLPWLVACANDGVVGFAYASAYRTRPGYRWTVEDSVYVRDDARGLGIGPRLLGALVDRCTALGYRRMIAVIGDETNTTSVALHARAGFTVAGRFPGIGRKHGRWLTGVQMQRALGDGDASAPFAEPGATA